MLGSPAMRLPLGSLVGLCVVLSAASFAACSSDDSGGSPASGGAAGTAGSGGMGAVAGTGGLDAGVDAAQDAANDAAFTPDGFVPEPEPGHIDFAAKNPIPSGLTLLFNDWNSNPNRVLSIQPNGTGETEVFQAYRVWSLGASHDGNTVAFACGDPDQLGHYGLTLGDAIQNTWTYDTASQTAKVLSWGNLNDECHTFNQTDDRIYVCRRYDFQVLPGPQFTNKGYQLGRIDVASGGFEFLTPEPVMKLELSPQPSADESELYYTLIEISGGKQTRSIVKMTLPGGTPTKIKDNATLRSLSPDGQKLLYQDHNDKGTLYVSDTAGQGAVKITDHPGTSASFSPDGTQVAYLYGETQTCNHIELVKADGSEAATPVRVRDCKTEIITDLTWIDKP